MNQLHVNDLPLQWRQDQVQRYQTDVFDMWLFKRRSANNTSPAERKESRIYRQQRSEVTMLDAYKECSFLSGASLTLTMSTAFQQTHTMFLLHWACFGLVELCVYVYECVCVG